MKRKTLLLLFIALALCAAAGCSKTTEPSFAQLESLNWSFSSGAGAWATDIQILADGSFTGEYHDSDMGDTGEGYPDGTVYHCAFSGRMSMAGQADGNAWRVRVEALDKAPGQEGETIEDGMRIIYTDPYGLSQGDEMLLYRPGTPMSVFSEEMRPWLGLFDPENPPSSLETWFLASEKNGSGFIALPAAAP